MYIARDPDSILDRSNIFRNKFIIVCKIKFRGIINILDGLRWKSNNKRHDNISKIHLNKNTYMY